MASINKLKNKFKDFKSRIALKEFLFICVFSFMLVINFFVFGQFEVMLSNQRDFGISVSEVMWFFILMTAIILLLVIALLTILCSFTKRGYSYTVATLIGLVIAGYAQTLFMNDADKMTVAGLVVRASVLEFILNTVINIALIALPIVLLKQARKRKLSFTAKLSFVLAVAVLGMQCVGLMSTSLTVYHPPKGGENYYFSIDEQFKLSKNDNIVVFVLDRFDTDFSDAIFEKHGETKEIFDGFTYYRNNISEYPGTFPSVTAMLTDKPFDKKIKKQIDYLQDAWESESLFSALKDKNYKSKAIFDVNATFYDFRDIEDKFDNVRQVEAKNRQIKYMDFYAAMTSFALVRQAPYIVKPVFRNDRYYNIANYCVEIKNTPDYFQRTVSPEGDLKYYEKLMTKNSATETALSAVEEDNVFSIVHLQASHRPYDYDQNLKPMSRTLKDFVGLSDDEKAIRQTRGTFKILNEYFDQMKKLGIYESSTIIILGDHGAWENVDKKLNDVPLTSLLVKTKDSLNQPLVTDSTSQLSNNNFDATILEIIGAKDVKPNKKSYFDIIANGGEQPSRIFYNVKWTNLNSCTYLCTYEVNGDASKIENWKTIK